MLNNLCTRIHLTMHYIGDTHAPNNLGSFFFQNPFLCDSCKSRNIWLPGVVGITSRCIVIPTTPRDLCHTFLNIQLSTLCTDPTYTDICITTNPFIEKPLHISPLLMLRLKQHTVIRTHYLIGLVRTPYHSAIVVSDCKGYQT